MRRPRSRSLPRVLAVKQSIFQQRVWRVAQNAHAVADRADARILMRMIEVVDDGDYVDLPELAKALREPYRQSIGVIPADRTDDMTAG